MTDDTKITGNDRRGFLVKAAATLLAAAACAAPVGLGLLAFVNPWRRRGPAADDQGFVAVARLSALGVGGPPQPCDAVATRQDAWTWSREPIGRVFLVRTGAERVRAFQALCPHAGCPIQFRPALGCFACTCHTHPQFDLAGKRLDEHSTSPRDLDELETRIAPGGEVLVKYEKFRAGIAEKIAVT
jgi:Rieske Fe-S protein